MKNIYLALFFAAVIGYNALAVTINGPLVGAQLENAASNLTGVTGRIMFNTTSAAPKYYAGSWKTFAPIETPTFVGTVTVPILNGTDATDSSSSTTGAMTTAGGLGVAKKLYVGGAANMLGDLNTNRIIGTYTASGSSAAGLSMTTTNTNAFTTGMSPTAILHMTDATSRFVYGISAITKADVASGISNGGTARGASIELHRAGVSGTVDDGTYGTLNGVFSDVYNDVTEPTSDPITTNMYGLYSRMSVLSGTVSNLVGLYLPAVNMAATPSAWAATTAYTVGNKVKPTGASTGFYYVCTVAGTSAGSEPTWPVVRGNTVTDGGVTWKTVQIPAITTRWGVYQVDGSANNALQGKTRIGSATAPTNALDVTGSATVSADLTVSGKVNLASMLASNTAPTIASGFCTGGAGTAVTHANGTAAVHVTLGSSSCGSTGVIGLPAAANGWHCMASDIATSDRVEQTAFTTTSATLGHFDKNTGNAANFQASDQMLVSCFAF